MRVALYRCEVVVPVETGSGIVKCVNHHQPATSSLSGMGNAGQCIHQNLSPIAEPVKIGVHCQPGQQIARHGAEAR